MATPTIHAAAAVVAREHPIVACYRGRDSADAVMLGALLAGALHEPLILATAYRYEPVGFSARPLQAPPTNLARAMRSTRCAMRAR